MSVWLLKIPNIVALQCIHRENVCARVRANEINDSRSQFRRNCLPYPQITFNYDYRYNFYAADNILFWIVTYNVIIKFRYDYNR